MQSRWLVVDVEDRFFNKSFLLANLTYNVLIPEKRHNFTVSPVHNARERRKIGSTTYSNCESLQYKNQALSLV